MKSTSQNTVGGRWTSPGGENYLSIVRNYLNGAPDYEIRVSEPGDILSTEPIFNGLGERLYCPEQGLPYLLRGARAQGQAL